MALCGLVHTNTVLVTFLWLTHILKRNCHRGPYFLVALESLLFHAFQGRMCHEPFIALKCKQRQSKNSKADDQKEIQGARNKFNGKKELSFFWKGSKERRESGVGVRGAEAASTTDLAPAQTPRWSWASQAVFSQYVPDFSHISPQMFSFSI